MMDKALIAEMREIIALARQNDKILPVDKAFELHPVEEEDHKGKIAYWWLKMNSYKTVEREINKIRLEIYEETKNMTREQRKERLDKIVDDVQKEFGLRRIASAKQ